MTFDISCISILDKTDKPLVFACQNEYLVKYQQITHVSLDLIQEKCNTIF